MTDRDPDGPEWEEGHLHAARREEGHLAPTPVPAARRDLDAERRRRVAAPDRILVVDLLGGVGDLVMALPLVHALHRRHPGAELRVLTHAPGDELLRHDPAVSAVVRAERGRERDG